MHHIERAVVMAAGEGRRLRPVTLATPKPLLPVNGVRFIDSVIGALHDNGITEIYVVTGYLAEQYASLPAQYPGVTLLHNPYYQTCNNISSAFVARAHLENAILSEADLLVRDPAVFAPEFARSCYCATREPVENEWGLTLDASGAVTRCDVSGRTGTHRLYGVSLWTAEDGRRLKTHLEQAFETDGVRDVYWDELALFLHADAYTLGVREISDGALTEIDTLTELAAMDASYEPYLHPAE